VQAVLIKALLVLFYVYLLAALFLNVNGLPGNWGLVGTALIIKLVPYFDSFTWVYFFVVLGLAIVAEVIESFLGLVVVAKKGGSRWGVLGSFVGGIAGVILGAAFIPPVGSVLFGLAGAFAGAVLGEYLNEQKTETALKVGFWSFVGRSLAIMGKVAAGACIVWILIVKTWF
jgi:uncharacterized protein YqgC (DUF456 family)